MTLDELLKELEPGTIFQIEKLPDGLIKATTEYLDGSKIIGIGKTVQEALDDEQ